MSEEKNYKEIIAVIVAGLCSNPNIVSLTDVLANDGNTELHRDKLKKRIVMTAMDLYEDL